MTTRESLETNDNLFYSEIDSHKLQYIGRKTKSAKLNLLSWFVN
jgi:hypothetical protein